jgi:arylsulfatase A-like enzyme
MKSTNKIFVLALAAGAVSSCQQKAGQEESKKQPNILFIMSDDHAYQAISAYQDHLIKTPNIDRLAEEGMKFTNACVTNSISAPSRAVILTGKHCHINGKIDNRFPFDTSQTTLPQIMQAAGYQTAMFGKLHFGNNPKGVDVFKILPGQGNYINPKFLTNNGDTTYTGYVTDIITDLTLDWLKNDRDEAKPFMMMYLHKAPHRPWWPRPDKFKKFTKKTFPEPPNLFDDYKNRGTAAKEAEMNILRHMLYDHDHKIRPEVLNEMGELNPDLPPTEWGFHGPYGRANEEQRAQYGPVLDSINDFFKANWKSMSLEEKMKWKYQRYMQDYLGCIESIDENVGRVLDYLDESGLAENTIVVYTSDQGFYLGEHGWFDKRFIYNESFLTPLLVRWPGVVKPGSVSDEMVQNLDFAQTFLDAAGIEQPEDMQGESIMPLLSGHLDAWNRDAVYYHYYEYPSVHMVKRHYGIVTPEYKLAHFYYDIDEWELYDRKKDPMEMNNVFDDPAYSNIVDSMKVELKKIREKYKDSKELDQKYIKLYKSKKFE